MDRNDLAVLGVVLILFSVLFGGWLCFLGGLILCLASAFLPDRK